MKFCGARARVFVILFSLVMCQQASAIIVFAPTLNYTTFKIDTSETTSLMSDLRLGTVLGSAFYVGGLYDIQRDDSGGAETNTWGAAPSAGIYLTNFSFIFSYYLVSERQTPSTKFTGGKGPQVDIAYALDLGSGVKLGPQFTWREIQYTTPSTTKISSLRPYIALFFEF